ncbi:MAG: DUF4123 domain-containing protein [Rikenellaceae bacterium]|nr:DUF4123 domain-containing protein [Rikenellaceae bacterium]
MANTYLILDGALWKEDMELALQSGSPNRSLYRGKPAEELYRVAPYLFELSGCDDFEKWVNRRESKDPLGRRTLRMVSDLPIDELRKHLRRFLRVKKENGKILYYRFYDPKTISCTLPNLTPEQLEELFRGVNVLFHFTDILKEKRSYVYRDGKLEINVENDYIL